MVNPQEVVAGCRANLRLDIKHYAEYRLTRYESGRYCGMCV
jgi:hypothetical protein